MKITDHFELAEFLVSSHPDLLISPNQAQLQNLYLLSTFALEPIRAEFGVVQITSGLRSEALNAVVGGVSSSQHLTGSAVDFICPYAVAMGPVYLWIIQTLKWPGECFWYKKKGHIHVGLPSLYVHANQEVLEA